MPRPVRLQLSRNKGFDLQEHSRFTNGLFAVNVARPTKWGNTFIHDQPAVAVEHFEGLWRCALAQSPDKTKDKLWPLIGKNLACWCALDQPCHADVLMRLCEEIA